MEDIIVNGLEHRKVNSLTIRYETVLIMLVSLCIRVYLTLKSNEVCLSVLHSWSR